MNILNVQQGSQEWIAARCRHFTSSEAPAMLGLSRYTSRDVLLAQKATGIMPEVSVQQQAMFDRGHEAESATRPIAEEIVMAALYPVTGAVEIDGMPLLASFDGLTLAEDTAWENKLWNEKLSAHIFEKDDVPDTHWPQLEQQLLVSGAKRVLFTVSDGTPERCVSLFYESKPERRARLIAGWKQFAADLAKWQPVAQTAPVVAAPVEGFGALVIQVEGRVTACNLDAFKASAQAFIASLPKPANLQTDQDFADAKAAVTTIAEARDRIKAAKAQGMAQMADVDAVFRTADEIDGWLQKAHAALDKAVKAESDTRKMMLITEAAQAFARHIKPLQEELPDVFFQPPPPDFAGAIKGLKTLASIKEKLNTALVNGKIEADLQAADWRKKLGYYHKTAASHKTLFPDLGSIIGKPEEDFRMTVALRISRHEAAEAAKLEEERERIRLEEERKARAVAEQAAEAERQCIRAEEQAKAEAKAKSTDTPPAPQTVTAPPAASLDDSMTLTLGEICKRIGITMTAAFMADTLGIHPSGAGKNGCGLYRESDFPRICAALVQHIQSVSLKDGEHGKS